MGIPTRIGHSYTRPGESDTSITLRPDGTIAVGHWMVAVLATTPSSAPVTPPAGWVTLQPKKSGGTVGLSFFGRIRKSGDSVYTFAVASGGFQSTGALMWGAGATDPSHWSVGTTGWREVTGTDTSNVAPGVTTSGPALVLSISAERTDNWESEVSSVYAATEWFFVQQSGDDWDTICVAYTTQSSPRKTADVTFKYPNPQSLNGVAIQLAIAGAGAPPVPSFTTSLSGFTLNVDASASTTEATITSYEWNWADGKNSTGQKASHTYSHDGVYAVTLKVTDSNGASASTTQSVTVNVVETATVAPSRDGFAITSPGQSDTAVTLTPDGSIATGDWMLAVFASTGGPTITPPAGWVALQSRYSAGTDAEAIYGKVRAAGDGAYTFAFSSAGLSTTAVLVWGSGATAFENWIVGPNTSRTSDTVNVASGLNNPYSDSLVLAISTERTTANESDVVSITGGTEWLFVPQPSAGSVGGTIAIAYQTDVDAGKTADVTFTYPNASALNGQARQIVIPGEAAVVNGMASVWTGTASRAMNASVWDGSREVQGVELVPWMATGPTVSQLASTGMYVASRGGSENWPEETLRAYEESAFVYNMSAIELSVQKSSDGVFVAIHDATTDSVTGASYTVSSTPWSTLSTLSVTAETTDNPTQPREPLAKLDDILALYGGKRVIFIDDKTGSNASAILDLMDAHGGTDWYVWKTDGTTAGQSATVTARGYKTWGYYFDTNMASFDATQAGWDFVGLDWNSSDATLQAAIAEAGPRRAIGHIIYTVDQRDRLLGLGCMGLMIADVRACITLPYRGDIVPIPVPDDGTGGNTGGSTGDTGGGTIPSTNTVVVPEGSTWAYWYKNEGTLPPTTWINNGYDDSAWTTGAAPIGYGETGLATTMTAGSPISLSAFFRSEFQITDATTVASLTLTTRADDGIIVYVNGTKVGSSNVNDTVYAVAPVTPANAIANPITITVSGGLLVTGTNTIAAEVRANYHGTDISFELKAEAVAGTQPTNPTPPPDSGNGYIDGWGYPVFEDQFGGTAVDTNKWNVKNGWKDAQDQSEMLPANVIVENDTVKLRVKRETSPGGRPFTSGYIDTIGKFSQRYGRWEGRFKLPTLPNVSRGMWPAFWLRDDQGGGECDIFESYGSPNNHPDQYPASPGRHSSSLYRNTGNQSTGYWGGLFSDIDTADGGWHTFAVEWTPDAWTFYHDGKKIATKTVADNPWIADGFTTKAHIRLDVFVGSSWIGYPDPNHPEWTVTPADMVIDYIRVWEYTAPSTGGTTPPPPVVVTGIPQWDHIVIAVMENHSETEIIGSSGAPYLTSLAANNIHFTQSYGLTHPSQPNYLMLFSGSNQGVTDDNLHTPSGAANIYTQLAAAGKTFKGFAQSLPSVGYTGSSYGAYVRYHCPWMQFSNVPTTLHVPFTQFPTDAAGYAALPTLSYVIPDKDNDMHDGSVSAGDTWLKNNLDGYAQWAKANNSLLIITFDEDDFTTTNRITTVMVGAHQKPGDYTEHIDHYNVLGLMEDSLGLPRLAGSVGKAQITGMWQ